MVRALTGAAATGSSRETKQVREPVWQAGPVWRTRYRTASPSQSSRTSATSWVWPEVSPFRQSAFRLRLK